MEEDDEVLALTLGLGKGRVLVGLTAANAKADVVTWLILTVAVVFAEIVGRG